MELKECIKAILDEFNPGDYFDSHTVINELIANKDYHIAYLKEYSEKCTVAQYHGKIAKMIGSFDCIQDTSLSAKSHTIYGDITSNELWQKK
ncbi:MAG: hypothetical protein K2O09_06200 [Treponemataceae bacterium]|nr:hypothetical protein [Treponemataceae bacterium]